MRDNITDWARVGRHYRWFVGFGVVWLGIVTTVTPVLGPLDEVFSEGERPVAAAASAAVNPVAAPVRGTLGAVSSPTNAAAGAIPIGLGFDSSSTFGPTLEEPSDSSFDEPPSFEGFDSSDEEPEPEPEPEPDTPSDGGDAPAGCTTDTSLPAPVVTTVVGAITDAQAQVGGATGQPLPADPAGTVGGAAGCGGSETGSTTGSQAPSMSNGVTAGGLTATELLRILFGW